MAYTMTDRIEALREFRDALQTIDVRSDAEFRRIVKTAQELLEMSDREIGDAVGVSRPSVNRWINGKNLPHYAIRKPVARWAVEQVTARIHKVENFNRSTSSRSSAMAYMASVATKSR
jgi:hypothetical protein